MTKEELTTHIIDVILKSPLNIKALPDDIEREMYEKILNLIILELDTEECMSGIKRMFKKLWRCISCKKSRTD